MAMTLTLCRALAPAVIAAASVVAAQAQQSPNCPRLEAQLQAFDRSTVDPARADQIRRYEEAAARQQAEIDQQQVLAQRTGCGKNSFYVLFSGEPAACGPMNAKIQQMRANLDNIQGELTRQRGAAPERDGQRRSILVALAQNNCGDQYRAAAATPQPRSGGLFEALFGGNRSAPAAAANPDSNPDAITGPSWSVPSGSYRTVCVRTCDGYYYPISYAADPSRFAEDEKTCRRSCPAAEVMLFAHRNPGEDINQAVSVSGQPYSALPNAFKYRQSFDQACSCRNPGESWAKALKGVDDNADERGDIVVNDPRARQLSQPRDAQGRPIASTPRAPVKLQPNADAKPDPQAAKTDAGANAAKTEPPAADAAKSDEAPSKPDPNRTVRAVGPTFLPAR